MTRARKWASTITAVIVPLLSVAGCGDDDNATPDAAPPDAALHDAEPQPDAQVLPDPTQDFSRDLVSTDLVFEVEALRGTATIELTPSTTSEGASFEAAGLTITGVHNGDAPLNYEVVDGRLDVGVPLGSTTVVVEYGFSVQGQFNGLMATGSTLTWPYYCGNLFPCKSDPTEGLTFTMSVIDLPAGELAVYPSSIPADAPSYMPAWATGEYAELELGTTSGGTHLRAWYLPGGENDATQGTANLVAIFDWFEATYGPYPFGAEAGTVATNWGPGAYGGMEHHPYWHVAIIAMHDEVVQAHEAAHGWFGNGVRIACWEDFVLSEGTVSYLAARGIGEVLGTTDASSVWQSYQNQLNSLMGSAVPKIAWPDSCGDVDILEDQLFTQIPYMKGAFFFRALEQRITRATLDAALAAFFSDWVGQAAGMQDLLDEIQATSGYDPTTCAQSWLREEPVGPDVCP